MTGTKVASIMGKVEAHLGPNADDDLFAKAMTYMCEGFPPDCSHHETCLHEGDCFRKNPARDAAKIIEAAASKQCGVVRRYLDAAAAALRRDEISIRTADILSF